MAILVHSRRQIPVVGFESRKPHVSKAGFWRESALEILIENIEPASAWLSRDFGRDCGRDCGRYCGRYFGHGKGSFVSEHRLCKPNVMVRKRA